MMTARTQTRHRLQLIANATCAGSDLFRDIRERADEGETDLLMVAPALSSRLHCWVSDEDAGMKGTPHAHRSRRRPRRVPCGHRRTGRSARSGTRAARDARLWVILATAVVPYTVSSALRRLPGAGHSGVVDGATWFLIFDLGLTIAIIVVVWTLFQRRPRADRLEY